LNYIIVVAVFDATSGFLYFISLLLFHGHQEASLFSREKVSLDPNAGIGALHTSDMGHAGFSRMDQNLRST
jgi:hypothetical protein